MTTTPVTSETVPDKRGGRSPRDMALSLLVLIVPVVLLILIYRGLHGGDAPITADPAPHVSRAASAGLTVVPRSLPEGWQVATASFNGQTNTLRLGYLTSKKIGLQLVEARRADLAREELTSSGVQTGTVTVGAAQWQVWTGRPEENALVGTRDGITIVISGRASQEDLVALAATL